MNDIKYYFEKAKQEKFAVGAFNAANIETLKAIVGAAFELKSPVIIEASAGEVSYIGDKELRALVDVYKERFNIPIFLNLDHSHDVQASFEAIDAGYDLIHFDGGELEFTLNIEQTKQVVEKAHLSNLIVEGEIDHIQGSSADHRLTDASEMQKLGSYTKPEQALDFVNKTKVDILASFIGNVHGIYKESPILDLELLKQISNIIPDTYLSLHGGSGISAQYITGAISSGNIVKINVNSELRIAFKETLTKEVNNTDEISVYKFMGPVIDSVKQVVMDKMQLFGSVGKI
jgi:fructose-bisphosphate aldolase, class II